MADKYGSNRYGWNQRGGTDGEILRQAKEQSAILDPESLYWKNRALNSGQNLADCMGTKDFQEWAERLLPGDSIDEISWEEIHELYEGKFQRVQAEAAMGEGHDWEDDPKHCKMNGVF